MVFLVFIPTPIKKLSDTKEYFSKLNAEFGAMTKGEWIGLILFSFATVAAFARPLFADWFPALRPAYVFFCCGMLCFVLKDEKGNMMVQWKQVEKELMWGMCSAQDLIAFDSIPSDSAKPIDARKKDNCN